ncbi:hypothetical protein MUK42_35305 [Musa troglodytarum]|uniref:Uncharacterized protein n=1 Tax=Musa troglodytarum TaxID=320322 RepID=A0A9E7EEF7_9LILI|nr:hypothetical protein MUK42_35305 [Musa troglodytarum]
MHVTDVGYLILTYVTRASPPDQPLFFLPPRRLHAAVAVAICLSAWRCHARLVLSTAGHRLLLSPPCAPPNPPRTDLGFLERQQIRATVGSYCNLGELEP